jgi:hypothetical protein
VIRRRRGSQKTRDGGAPITPPPQAFKAAVEQAGVFLQAAYRFGATWL